MDEELISTLAENSIQAGFPVTPADKEATEKNLQAEINNLKESITNFNASLTPEQSDFAINEADQVSQFIGLLKGKADIGKIDMQSVSKQNVLSSEVKIFKDNMFLQNRVDTLYNRAVDRGIEAGLAAAFVGLTAKQIAQTKLFQKDPVQAVFELGATIGTEALSLYCQEKLGFSKEAAEAHSRVIVGISQERVDTENDDSIRADVNLRLMQATDMILEMPESLEECLALAKSLHRVVEDSSRDPEGLIKVDNLDEKSKNSLKNLDGVKAFDLYQKLSELEKNLGDYLPSLRGKSEKEYDEEAKKIIDKIRLTQKEKNGLYSMRTPQQEVKSQQAEENVFNKFDLDKYLDKEMGERTDPIKYYDYKSKDIIAHIWNIGPDGKLEQDNSINYEQKKPEQQIAQEQPQQEQPQQEEQISQEQIQEEQQIAQEQVQQAQQDVNEQIQEEQREQPQNQGFNANTDIKLESSEPEEKASVEKKGLFARIADRLKQRREAFNEEVSKRSVMGLKSRPRVIFEMFTDRLGSMGEALTNLPKTLTKGREQKQLPSGENEERMALGEGIAKQETVTVEQEDRKDQQSGQEQARTSFEDSIRVDAQGLQNIPLNPNLMQNQPNPEKSQEESEKDDNDR